MKIDKYYKQIAEMTQYEEYPESKRFVKIYNYYKHCWAQCYIERNNLFLKFYEKTNSGKNKIFFEQKMFDGTNKRIFFYEACLESKVFLSSIDNLTDKEIEKLEEDVGGSFIEFFLFINHKKIDQSNLKQEIIDFLKKYKISYKKPKKIKEFVLKYKKISI